MALCPFQWSSLCGLVMHNLAETSGQEVCLPGVQPFKWSLSGLSNGQVVSSPRTNLVLISVSYLCFHLCYLAPHRGTS